MFFRSIQNPKKETLELNHQKIVTETNRVQFMKDEPGWSTEACVTSLIRLADIVSQRNSTIQR